MMKMDANSGENDGEASNHDRPSMRKSSVANKGEALL